MTEATVAQLIAESLDLPAAPLPETPLSDLGIDSLTLLEIVLRIEERFPHVFVETTELDVLMKGTVGQLSERFSGK